tara:strand:- start:248 stop:682 length:435 start_codon:yes stop_codon:yes gene_type:complete
MLLTFDDNYIIMAFMIESKTTHKKQVKNTLEKSQNYSRIPLTNDDNYIIMANMTNNNNTIATKDNNNMFTVIQTIARFGRFNQEAIRSFPTMKEAAAFAKRCHCGNPTTAIRDNKTHKVFTAHKDTNGTSLVWQTGPIFADKIV